MQLRDIWVWHCVSIILKKTNLVFTVLFNIVFFLYVVYMAEKPMLRCYSFCNFLTVSCTPRHDVHLYTLNTEGVTPHTPLVTGV